MDDNYVLKEGSPTSPMLDEHSTATIIEKTVDVSDIGEFIIGESNSSIITFRMNRYYDGVDLLEKTIKVMYRNSNGIFESDVVNIKYTSNSLKFSWIVPHDATTSKKLLAYVCFVSDGYLWKTKTFTITVDQSFDVGDSEPTQNWFVNIESKLTKIEKTIDEAVGKLSKQIPTKVSDLENDLAVSYSAQELTSEQKQQVRENINVGVSKKVVTYNGAKRSFRVGVIEGTIADLPEDSASEYLEAYKNFWHVCEYMRIFKLTTWQFAKNALKWLSSAHKNNIISDSLTFYVTKPSKYIKYSYNVNTQGRAYDLMEYYDEGATLKLSYYPDTDEFEDNQMDAKWSKPITMNSYGLDNNTPLVEQFELSKNPISDMEVATKEYVDDNIGVSKKVITYDGASSSYTILISEGTVNDIKSDSTEEFIEGYKTFYSAIQLTRFMVSPYWRGLKTLLKRLSDAHRVGIISDKLTYSVDQSFTEINYSYGKARDNKYFDCIVFINNGKKARLSYYPDTDEYSTNDSDNYIKEALIKNTNGTDSTNSSVYQFNMDEDPTSDMQVATKQYVDNKIMYVNITEEEIKNNDENRAITYKSDKTFGEIAKAVSDGKSVVAVYKEYYLYLIDSSKYMHVFEGSNRSIHINSSSSVNYFINSEVPIDYEITYTKTNFSISNSSLYGSIINKNIQLNITKYSTKKYSLILYPVDNKNWTTITTIDDKNMLCQLMIEDESDTSTWDYTETEIPKLYANDTMSDYVSTDKFVEFNSVYKDKNGFLYNERSVKYYDTMDEVSNNNTTSGTIAIVKSKGNSDIDISYPVIVYSTTVQSYGRFDGWIVDACGNHYEGSIGPSGVYLGELMIHGIPQPSKNDANKVLCGDMTWKDAQNITDEHINTLIDKKLGVIENGTY